MEGHLTHCLLLATVASALMNMSAGVFVRISIFNPLGHIPRSEIARSRGNSVFNFSRDRQSHSSYTVVHAHTSV